MKISEFISACKLENSDLKEVLECHPKQIISDYLRIPVWKVTYKYLTQRGNEKIATKYIFNYTEAEWDGVDNDVKNYIEEFNKEHPERPITNGEILGLSFMGYLNFDLD